MLVFLGDGQLVKAGREVDLSEVSLTLEVGEHALHVP